MRHVHSLRNLIMFLPLLFAIPLAGCAGTTSVSGVSVPSIGQVQTFVTRLCGYLPTASTVANIIASGAPGLSTAETIAAAICVAVSTPTAQMGPMSRAQRVPTVAGVPIYGKFVK